MYKIVAFVLAFVGVAAAAGAQSSTPNISLQIPATGSNNWYIPLNYNFTKIDQLLSGVLPVPAFAVTGNVTVGGTVTAAGFVGAGGAAFALTPGATVGAVPYFSGVSGTSRTLSGVTMTGIPVYPGSGAPTQATYNNIVGLWASGACTGYLSSDGTCSTTPGGGITTLTGDVTATGPGSAAATTIKVHGVTYPATPSTNTVPVVTGSNTVTYETVPNAALTNSSTTVNGQNCSLGGTCTIATGSGVTSFNTRTGVVVLSHTDVSTATQTSTLCSVVGTVYSPLADACVPSSPIASRLTSGIQSRSTLTIAAPYNVSITSGTANFGPSTGQTSRNWMDFGHILRVRQGGTISQIKVAIPSITGITGFYVSNCRTAHIGDTSPTSVDTISTSNNLAPSLATGINTLTLSTPLTGVIEGDYPCGRVEWSGGATVQNLFVKTIAQVGTVGIFYVDNASPNSVAYNYAAQSEVVGSIMAVEEDMAVSPVIACSGDSIMGGQVLNASFIDANYELTDTTVPYCENLGAVLGVPIQNWSIGGNGVGQIETFTAALLPLTHPRYVLLEGGVNDLVSGSSPSTIEATITTTLNAIQTEGATPILLGVFPFGGLSGVTTTMLQNRDTLNAWMKGAAVTYNGIYIDPSPYIGFYSSAGPAGNFWLSTSFYYGSDLEHPNRAGYNRVLQAVLDGIGNYSSGFQFAPFVPTFGPGATSTVVSTSTTYCPTSAQQEQLLLIGASVTLTFCGSGPTAGTIYTITPLGATVTLSGSIVGAPATIGAGTTLRLAYENGAWVNISNIPQQVGNRQNAVVNGGGTINLSTYDATSTTVVVGTTTITAPSSATNGTVVTIVPLAGNTVTFTGTLDAQVPSTISAPQTLTLAYVAGIWYASNGRSASSGLSGMTTGQVPIAATATTVTSSMVLAGVGAGVVTGPTSVSGVGCVATYADLLGTMQCSGTALSALAILNSPGFSGTPTTPTQTFGDNTTKIASDAFVQTAVAAMAHPHNNGTNIQGALFATSVMLGQVWYEPIGGSGFAFVRLSGTISCTVAPSVQIMDLGTSPSTTYGSATAWATIATGTSDGVYPVSLGSAGTVTAGHFYGAAFSAGTCVTAPTFDITMANQ